MRMPNADDLVMEARRLGVDAGELLGSVVRLCGPKNVSGVDPQRCAEID